MELLTEFELYKSKIDNCISSFVELLGGDREKLNQVDTFNGLISYIANNAFRNDKTDNNGRLSTTVNIDNVPLLNDLFNYYVLLCGMYNKKPYVMQYCIFIGISYDMFYRWETGVERASTTRIQLCKNIHNTCEQAQVSADTVKSIFLLKSKYGYVETPQQINITTELKQPTTDLISKYKDFPQLENQ